MGKHPPRGALNVVLTAVLCTVGLVAPQESLAARRSETPPTTYVAAAADGLTVGGAGASAILYWWASCGNEFTPPLPAARGLATGTLDPPPVPVADAHSIYDPSTCDGTQPVGEQSVVHAGSVYWIQANGRIAARSLSAPENAPPLQTWRTVGTPPLFGNGVTPGLVIDDQALTWTETDAPPGSGMSVYQRRSRVVGGDDFSEGRVQAYHVAGTLSALTDGPAGARFVIDNEGGSATLLALLPGSGGTFTSQPLSVGTHVTAVAADAGAVYWAESNDTGYVIFHRSFTVDDTGVVSFGIARSITSTSGLPHGTRVTSLVVDPSSSASGQHDLWWSIDETSPAPSDPSLIHYVRSTNSVVPLLLQQDAAGLFQVVTDGRYVFWTDTNDIYRIRASSSPPHAVVEPLQTRDVSPDLPYLHGSSLDDYPFGADPGGQVDDLVVDQQNPNVLIAASQFAGPWRSTDAGRSWQQSGAGLTAGFTPNGSSVAIDPNDDSYVLYVTSNEGFGTTSTAKTWLSNNNGLTWNPVPISEIPGTCTPSEVAFASTTAFVVTSCGLYQSTDLVRWSRNTAAGAPPAGAHIAGLGSSLFACAGSTVFWSSDGGGTWTTRGVPSGFCQGTWPVAPVPETSGEPHRVVVLHGTSRPLTASLLDMSDGTSTGLGFPDTPGSPSGDVGVWVAPTTSGGPIVFGANGDHFFELEGSTWTQLPNLHWDAHSLAFPPFFDPAQGSCRMYTASDGSVDVNPTATVPGTPCDSAQGPWLRAQAGLHAYDTQAMSGVSETSCASPATPPCPNLYAPSADDGGWVRDLRGNPAWSPFHDCCGDDGGMAIDPALPNRLLITRGPDTMREYLSDRQIGSSMNGRTRPPPNYLDPGYPPSPSMSSMVRSMAGYDGSTPLAHGDDVAVQVIPDSPNAMTGHDQIVRRRDGGGWTNLGPSLAFNSVQQVATSGGDTGLVVWVLSTNGTVLRGAVDASGTITSWSVVYAGGNVSIMWANPYNPDELWIEDDAAHSIYRSFRSSGGTLAWTVADDLTSFATGFDPRFGASQWAIQRTQLNSGHFASLQHMWFAPSALSPIRTATLAVGDVAISHDGGLHWIPLSGALPWSSWLAHPWSTWYDAGSERAGAQSDLYVALAGRGIMQVTGPFETLIDVAYRYCPGCTRSPGASRIDPSTVSAVDDLTGRTTALTQDTDGVWRGDELLDGAGLGTLHYHLVVDGAVEPAQTRTITDVERSTGIVGTLMLSPGPSPYLPSVGPLSSSTSVAFATACAGLSTEVDVKTTITVPAGTAVTRAVMTVTSRTFDDNGDALDVLRKTVPMSSAGGNEWAAAFDSTRLGVHPTDFAVLVLQVQATSKGGPASGAPLTLTFQPCQKTTGSTPGRPAAPTAKPMKGAAYVSWSAPIHDGGQPITGYRLTPIEAGRALRAEFFGPDTTSSRIPGLKKGVSYTFVVQALNVFGAGTKSAPSNPIVPT